MLFPPLSFWAEEVEEEAALALFDFVEVPSPFDFDSLTFLSLWEDTALISALFESEPLSLLGSSLIDFTDTDSTELWTFSDDEMEGSSVLLRVEGEVEDCPAVEETLTDLTLTAPLEFADVFPVEGLFIIRNQIAI